MLIAVLLAQLTAPVEAGGLAVRLERTEPEKVVLVRVKVLDGRRGSTDVPLELGDRVATGTRVVVDALPPDWVVEVRRTMWTIADAPDPVEVTRSPWLPLRSAQGGSRLPTLGDPRRTSPKRLRAAFEARGGRFLKLLEAKEPLPLWFHEAAWEVRLVKVNGDQRDVVKQLTIRNTFGC